MNAMERVLDRELVDLVDRLASSIPEGGVAAAAAGQGMRARLDEVEARLSDLRATLLTDYGRWRRTLEDLENLWALASWRSVASQEPVDQAAALAA
jgi:hypothetical protein